MPMLQYAVDIWDLQILKLMESREEVFFFFGEKPPLLGVIEVDVYKHMNVSENSGTPKSSILIGFSIINHPFWGTPIFGKTHMVSLMECPNMPKCMKLARWWQLKYFYMFTPIPGEIFPF